MTTTQTPVAESSATISPGELTTLRTSDPAIHVIDVRTPGEYETAHIDGSYNVPLDLLGEHARELAALDRTVVLVCRSGARATKAMDRLVAAGKSNLRVLDGGITAWQAAGGDVTTGTTRRWELERQVRLVAGVLVAGSVLASLVYPSARYVAGFVGAGLTFAAVTNTCAMGMLLARLPYNRGPKCDMDAVLDQLTNARS